jgi:phosphatidylinositol phospholipase C delta
MFYQYKIKYIKLQTFLIIPIILFIYYFLKLLKEGNNFSLNDCLCFTNNYLLTNKITSIEIIKPHLLDKPLHEFYISTSHNTYLPCHQNIDISSIDAIKNALQLGARVIELDVYAKNNIGLTDDDYTPVVAHGKEYKYGDIFTTSFITFEESIKTIAEFAQTTSDPLWITLELNTNKLVKTQLKMKEILLKYFGNKIINSTTMLSNISIKNLLNKIILTSGDGLVSSSGVNSTNRITSGDGLVSSSGVNSTNRITSGDGLVSSSGINSTNRITSGDGLVSSSGVNSTNRITSGDGLVSSSGVNSTNRITSGDGLVSSSGINSTNRITSGDGLVSPLEDIIISYINYPYLKNTDHKDTNLKNINSIGIIYRVYPAGDIKGHFSYNFDPEPLWKNRYQLIALNFQKLDNNLNKNLSMFNKCSFVHFSEYN